MRFARRDMLKFTGGAAAGLALTPVPWSLFHDTALWTQNWPGIPRPPEGEISTRYTTCTMCPAACGVRARCAGGKVVSLAGVAGHPASHGALCANGLVGHHLAFHPQRARQPVDADAVLAAMRNALDGCVAMVDPRPGRVASMVYLRFLERLDHGVYCGYPGAGEPTCDSLSARIEPPCGGLGVDLENTRCVVSFGAPVLDGWLSPGRVLSNRSHFQLIQVEPAHSRTAALADLWVPVQPGCETDFALALARFLEGKSAASDPRVAQVAALLMANRPAIAIAGDYFAPPQITAIDELNRVLDNLGRRGGFVARREAAEPLITLEAAPDHSIRLLLIEESSAVQPLPRTLVRRKLARNGLVAALTPWLDGCGRYADYLIPAPAYLESLDEAPTPHGSPVAAFSLSPPLRNTPPGMMAPADFVLRLAGEPGSYAELLQQRAAAIYQEGRGSLFTYQDARSIPLPDVASAEEFWKALASGGCWRDDPARPSTLRMRRSGARELPAAAPCAPLMLVAASRLDPRRVSPLMTKLDQESDLRRGPGQAALHPETGRQQGLEDGERAVVETSSGAATVEVLFDPAVMPGAIEVSGGSAWKYAPATIRRA